MRLIDADELKKAIKDNGYSHYFEILTVIDDAPTVIPEDFMNPYDEGFERGFIYVLDKAFSKFNANCTYSGNKVLSTLEMLKEGRE